MALQEPKTLPVQSLAQTFPDAAKHFADLTSQNKWSSEKVAELNEMAQNWSSAEIAQVTESLEEELKNITLQEADENQRKRQRVGEASSSSGHQTPSGTVGKVLLNTNQLAVKKVEP